MKSVFISYAREDRDGALAVHRSLMENGLSPWIDVLDLLPGQDWEYEIDSAIRESNVFLACISMKSVSKRGFVQSELRKGLKVLETIPEGQLYLIPVRLDDCDVPQKLGHLHWVDYFATDGPAKLLSAIRLQLGVEGKSTSQGLPNRGVTFANIAVDRSSPYWEEIGKPPGYPFNRECRQYFNRRSNSNPSFDVTLINVIESPVLLTAVGVEIVSVAHRITLLGLPEAVKVFKSDVYSVEMPDLRTRLFGRISIKGREFPVPRNLSQHEVNELVSKGIPDPIYLESKAPYRYGLIFESYNQRMPNRVIARLWARTSEGETKSDEIYLSTLY
jgi:hypothetical protein